MSFVKAPVSLKTSSSNSSIHSTESSSSSSSSSGVWCNKFATHKGLVKYVCLGQTTGEVFASVSNDEQIKLWSISNTDCLLTLKPKSSTETVQFSANEEILASGSLRGTINLWDLNKEKAFFQLKAHDQTVKHVDFYKAGTFFSTGSSDRTVKLWDIKQSTPVHKYEGHARGIVVQKFSTHGLWIASGDCSGVIKIWDMTACKLLAELRGHSSSILDIQFHPKVMLMASSSADGTVCFWELDRFSLLGSTSSSTKANVNTKQANFNSNQSTPNDCGPVNRIHFHPNGHQLIAVAKNKYLLYFFDDRVELQTQREQDFGLARDLAINRDGLVVATYNSNAVSLHQIKWGELLDRPRLNHHHQLSDRSRLRNFDNEQMQKAYTQLESLSSRNSEEYNSGFEQEDEFLSELNFEQTVPPTENKPFCPKRELSRTPTKIKQDLDSTFLIRNESESKTNEYLEPLFLPNQPNQSSKLSKTAKVRDVHHSNKSVSMRNLNQIGMNDYNQLDRIDPSLAQSFHHLHSNHANRFVGSHLDLANDATLFNNSINTTKQYNPPFLTPQPNRVTNQVAHSNKPTRLPNELNMMNLCLNNKPANTNSMYLSSRHLNFQSVAHPISNSVSIDHLPQLSSFNSNSYVLAGQHVNLPTLSMHNLNSPSQSGIVANVDAFNPLYSQSTDSSSATLAVDNILTEIAKDHTDTMLTLAQRESSLRMCIRTLDSDPIKTLQVASTTQDMILLADVVRLIVAKKKDWTIPFCQKLLPHLDTLLHTKKETCVGTVSSTLQFICQNLLPIIKQNMTKHPSIGVDVEHEERHEKAKNCYNQLIGMKSFVLKQQTLSGELGTHYRQIATHLDKLQ